MELEGQLSYNINVITLCQVTALKKHVFIYYSALFFEATTTLLFQLFTDYVNLLIMSNGAEEKHLGYIIKVGSSLLYFDIRPLYTFH